MNTFAIGRIVAIACTVLAATASARPRPPIAPFPEFTLKSWKFDVPEFVTAADLGAHVATNLWLAESWSGYALDMRAQDALLLTPAAPTVVDGMNVVIVKIGSTGKFFALFPKDPVASSILASPTGLQTAGLSTFANALSARF